MRRFLFIALLLSIFFSAFANKFIIKLVDETLFWVMSKDMTARVESLYAKNLPVLLFSKTRAATFTSIKIVPNNLLEEVGFGNLSIGFKVKHEEVGRDILNISHWAPFENESGLPNISCFKCKKKTSLLPFALSQNTGTEYIAFKQMLARKSTIGDNTFLNKFFFGKHYSNARNLLTGQQGESAILREFRYELHGLGRRMVSVKDMEASAKLTRYKQAQSELKSLMSRVERAEGLSAVGKAELIDGIKAADEQIQLFRFNLKLDGIKAKVNDLEGKSLDIRMNGYRQAQSELKSLMNRVERAEELSAEGKASLINRIKDADEQIQFNEFNIEWNVIMARINDLKGKKFDVVLAGYKQAQKDLKSLMNRVREAKKLDTESKALLINDLKDVKVDVVSGIEFCKFKIELDKIVDRGIDLKNKSLKEQLTGYKKLQREVKSLKTEIEKAKKLDEESKSSLINYVKDLENTFENNISKTRLEEFEPELNKMIEEWKGLDHYQHEDVRLKKTKALRSQAHQFFARIKKAKHLTKEDKTGLFESGKEFWNLTIGKTKVLKKSLKTSNFNTAQAKNEEKFGILTKKTEHQIKPLRVSYKEKMEELEDLGKQERNLIKKRTQLDIEIKQATEDFLGLKGKENTPESTQKLTGLVEAKNSVLNRALAEKEQINQQLAKIANQSNQLRNETGEMTRKINDLEKTRNEIEDQWNAADKKAKDIFDESDHTTAKSQSVAVSEKSSILSQSEGGKPKGSHPNPYMDFYEKMKADRTQASEIYLKFDQEMTKAKNKLKNVNAQLTELKKLPKDPSGEITKLQAERSNAEKIYNEQISLLQSELQPIEEKSKTSMATLFENEERIANIKLSIDETKAKIANAEKKWKLNQDQVSKSFNQAEKELTSRLNEIDEQLDHLKEMSTIDKQEKSVLLKSKERSEELVATTKKLIDQDPDNDEINQKTLISIKNDLNATDAKLREIKVRKAEEKNLLEQKTSLSNEIKRISEKHTNDTKVLKNNFKTIKTSLDEELDRLKIQLSDENESLELKHVEMDKLKEDLSGKKRVLNKAQRKKEQELGEFDAQIKEAQERPQTIKDLEDKRKELQTKLDGEDEARKDAYFKSERAHNEAKEKFAERIKPLDDTRDAEKEKLNQINAEIESMNKQDEDNSQKIVNLGKSKNRGKEEVKTRMTNLKNKIKANQSKRAELSESKTELEDNIKQKDANRLQLDNQIQLYLKEKKKTLREKGRTIGKDTYTDEYGEAYSSLKQARDGAEKIFEADKEATNIKIEETKTKLENIDKGNAAIEEEKLSLQNQLSVFTKERDEALDELKPAEEFQPEMEAEAGDKRANAEKGIEETNAQLLKLEEKKAEINAPIEKLRSDQETLPQELIQLEKEYNEKILNAEQIFVDEVRQIDQKMLNTSEEVKKIDARMEELKKEIAAKKKGIETLKANLVKEEKSLSKVKKDIGKKSGINAKCEKQLSEARSQEQTITAQLEQLNTETLSIQKNKATFETEKATLINEQTSLEKEQVEGQPVNEKQTRLEEVEEKLSELEKAATTNSEKVSNLNGELENVKNNIKELEESHQHFLTLKEERTTKGNKVLQIKRQITEAQDVSIGKKKEMSDLQDNRDRIKNKARWAKKDRTKIYEYDKTLIRENAKEERLNVLDGFDKNTNSNLKKKESELRRATTNNFKAGKDGIKEAALARASEEAPGAVEKINAEKSDMEIFDRKIKATRSMIEKSITKTLNETHAEAGKIFADTKGVKCIYNATLAKVEPEMKTAYEQALKEANDEVKGVYDKIITDVKNEASTHVSEEGSDILPKGKGKGSQSKQGFSKCCKITTGVTISSLLIGGGSVAVWVFVIH